MTASGDGKKLRTGFTTGTCAAAAAKAAAILLFTGVAPHEVDVDLPLNKNVTLLVHSANLENSIATCTIIKFAGDDPDVTDGAHISATLRRTTLKGICLVGGDGVGVVTKPGLGLEIGAPAITSVPRAIITDAVLAMAVKFGEKTDLEVSISVKDGKELARKTLNGRLGIKGGLSILGTTGIVYPFSVDAYTMCIQSSLNVASALGMGVVVVTTGRRTEKFAQNVFDLPEEAYIQMGDFIGYSLLEAAKNKIPKVIIAGMPGKLVKMSEGTFQTHAKNSLVNKSALSKLAADFGVLIAPEDINTVREVFELAGKSDEGHGLFTKICEMVVGKCEKCVRDDGFEIEVCAVMFDYSGEVVGRFPTDSQL